MSCVYCGSPSVRCTYTLEQRIVMALLSIFKINYPLSPYIVECNYCRKKYLLLATNVNGKNFILDQLHKALENSVNKMKEIGDKLNRHNVNIVDLANTYAMVIPMDFKNRIKRNLIGKSYKVHFLFKSNNKIYALIAIVNPKNNAVVIVDLECVN